MEHLRPSLSRQTLPGSDVDHWNLHWRIDSLDSSRRRCFCSSVDGEARFTHFGKLFVGQVDSPAHDQFCRQAVVGLQSAAAGIQRPVGGRLDCELPIIVYKRLDVQTLDEWLDVTGQPVVARLDVAERIVASVADLHDEGCAHRALRADHVLIDSTNQVYLAGLGDIALLDQHHIGEAEALSADMRGLARVLALLIGEQFLATPLAKAMQGASHSPTARQLYSLMQSSASAGQRRAA